MFIIDEKIDIERMRQFAGEWLKLQPEEQKAVLALYKNDQSIEYYCGMLSAFTSVFQILYHQVGGLSPVPEQTAKFFISASISHLSKMIKDKVE